MMMLVCVYCGGRGRGILLTLVGALIIAVEVPTHAVQEFNENYV